MGLTPQGTTEAFLGVAPGARGGFYGTWGKEARHPTRAHSASLFWSSLVESAEETSRWAEECFIVLVLYSSV